MPNLSPFGPGLKGIRSAFYAIYDGHAGRNAADYAAENLHVNIASRIGDGADNETVRKVCMCDVHVWMCACAVCVREVFMYVCMYVCMMWSYASVFVCVYVCMHVM